MGELSPGLQQLFLLIVFGAPHPAAVILFLYVINKELFGKEQ